MTTTTAMPELPEPDLGYIETDKSRQPAFSARQMRAALQAQPAEVSDAEIDYAVLQAVGFDGLGTQEMNQFDCRHIARAILALRPQAVPMTDEQVDAKCLTIQGHLLSRRDRDRAVWRLAEAHHGITAPAGGEKQA